MSLKHEAKLTLGAALRGFGPRIDFQQTEAVSVRAGRQAAGARCQDVCSYFPQTKIRLWTFSTATKDAPEFRRKGNNSAHTQQHSPLDCSGHSNKEKFYPTLTVELFSLIYVSYFTVYLCF